MAKIKYSALVSDMRNKLNGSVMSKNRYGSYVRNKVTPVNPQTSFQTNQRSNLSSLSTAWRSLTDAQRASWSNLALSAPRTDIFGDSKVLAGNALFVSYNLNLLASGTAQNSDAPQLENIPNLGVTALDFVVTAGALATANVTISPAAIPAGYKLIVYATPSVSAGIAFVKNRYRYLGTYTVTAGVADIKADITSRFGVPTVGEKVFVRVAFVNTTTGQLGLPSASQTIVTV